MNSVATYCCVLAGTRFQRGGIEYHVFCFADPAHADLFWERFGGERFEPADRGRGASWHQWRKG
jgi:hypothetical protein